MSKEHLRKELKAKRDAMLPTERKAASQEICAQFIKLYSTYSNYGVYVPISSEVCPLEIVEHLRKLGKTISLPVINGDEMRFKIWSEGAKLVSGRFSLEPESDNQIIIPEVIITPVLGFDDQLNRLGYGKGYYDKYFTQHHEIIKIGLAFSCQICKSIPCSQWDQPLDAIIKF